MATLVSQRTRQNIAATLEELPPESLPIVEQFVNFLKVQIAKTETDRKTEQISGLGGLWQDVDFDVDVKDIRRSRRELTQAVEHRMERYDLAV